MNLILEKRKLSIIEYLADLQDESVLLQIENLLKPTNPVIEITDSDERYIKKGLGQLQEGKRVALQDFIAKQKKVR